ncbi:MAG: universal stress protein [Thermodesulfobacteriota bacterium]
MVCYDGSDRSRNALNKTLDLFKDQNPDMMILLVAEETLDASMENEEVFEEWKKECHDLLNEVAKDVTQQGLEVDAILATGDPRTMIMEAIENKAPDLVVMAKRGKGSVKNALLGSVSTYVLRQAHCPVLVVKMPE